MSTRFRTMTPDQCDMLAAVEGTITSNELAEQFADRFERSRVQGLLNYLQRKGLVENVRGKWFRTEPGNAISEKLENGTYGRSNKSDNTNS